MDRIASNASATQCRAVLAQGITCGLQARVASGPSRGACDLGAATEPGFTGCTVHVHTHIHTRTAEGGSPGLRSSPLPSSSCRTRCCASGLAASANSAQATLWLLVSKPAIMSAPISGTRPCRPSSSPGGGGEGRQGRDCSVRGNAACGIERSP